MKLSDYMAQEGLSDQTLSATLGINRSTVSRLRRGLIRPSLDVAAKIQDATDGMVPITSWLSEPAATVTLDKAQLANGVE